MSWTLTTWPPNRDLLSVETYADTDPAVSVLADPSPEIRLEPPGRTVDMVWQADPTGFVCSPRSVVRFSMTDADANTVTAEGVVTILPGQDSFGSGPADGDKKALQEYQAEGMELLLKETIIDEPLVVESDQVYDIAHAFASAFKHPGYNTDAANFTGDIADVMEIAFSPEQTMFDFLTNLTEQFPTYHFYIRASDGHLVFELA